MKHYRLLKDLPTFKAGEEFYINDKGSLIFAKERTIVAYSRQTLEKFPSILSDWFEEIPEEYKRWRARVGGVYYHYEGGRTYRYTEMSDIVNDRLYTIGNYFKTEKEAEKYGEYLIALQIIKDDTKGFKPDWKDCDQIKYYGYYNHGDSCFDWDNALSCQSQGAVYFKTEEDLKESFEKHRKEWLIVLGVENEDR